MWFFDSSDVKCGALTPDRFKVSECFILRCTGATVCGTPDFNFAGFGCGLLTTLLLLIDFAGALGLAAIPSTNPLPRFLLAGLDDF